MDALKIRGGKPLSGVVEIGGAKNACLPILAATLLTPGKHQITNVPELADVRTMGQLLRGLGAEVTETGRNAYTIHTDKLTGFEAPYDLVRTMRASVLVLGPLLAREGRCRVSLPGGCAIGARPIDQHLKGLAALGAEIELVHGYVEAKAKQLVGAEFTFDMVTVTGTENVLMAAVRAQGETVLRNCAVEPEIEDLVKALRGMGAKITGDGTPVLRVAGVDSLQPMQHAVMRDRIEAGTFAAAAAMCQGDVLLLGAELSHFGSVADRMREAGVTLTQKDKGVRVFAPTRLRSVDIKTAPFPLFATDMQAQFMAMMCVAEGSAIISETVFENRYMHVPRATALGCQSDCRRWQRHRAWPGKAHGGDRDGHRPACLGLFGARGFGGGGRNHGSAHLPSGPGL